MGEQTEIQWCDMSFSPWWGCTPVSPGCANCYAGQMAKRFRGLEYRRGVPRQKTKDWAPPRKWNRESEGLIERPRIFPSMCDIFDDEVPSAWRAEFFDLVYETRNLDWLILTKRPVNAREMLMGSSGMIAGAFSDLWPNLWLGVSAEDQFQAEERIPILLEIPAVVRFASIEPMLGPVALSRAQVADETKWDFLRGERGPTCQHVAIRPDKTPRLDWVIYGGESGRGSRPCNVDWLRWGVIECESAGVPAFLKQLGSKPYFANEEKGRIKLKDSKGGNREEWPSYLPRLRQFPTPRP